MTARSIVVAITLVLFAAAPLAAQSDASWMRYPALSPDGQSIAFTYKGDLYRVASDRNGNFDLFVMPAMGGAARRLTVHSSDEFPYSFAVRGTQVVFGSARMDAAANRLYATGSQPELYQMPVAGGRPIQLITTPAEDARYSEESGTFNVHRQNLDGTQPQQLTDFRGIPVRFLSAANDGTIGFGHDGQLYTMRPGARPARVPFTIRTDSKTNDRQVIAVNGGARELAVSPSGKEVAFIFRGDVFVASVEGGVTKQLTNTPAVEVGVEFSPDGNAITYASERDAKWGIYEVRRTRDAELYFYASTVVRETALVVDTRQNYQPKYSPDGKELADVHIPGMNDGVYRTTFEEVMGKDALKKGIVVDTRFNGGGDLVADLAMFLSGTRFFDYTTDTRSNGDEPNFRWSKPSVSLANEANYSDGHCYVYAYKEQKIGPLIGMPVPGTYTFAGWETLQSGIRWGVPGVGVKDANTGRYLKNLQTEPDVLVMNEYDKVSNGQDQQLVAAVNALMRLVR